MVISGPALSQGGKRTAFPPLVTMRVLSGPSGLSGFQLQGLESSPLGLSLISQAWRLLLPVNGAGLLNCEL
jgi:hypothetical protein